MPVTVPPPLSRTSDGDEENGDSAADEEECERYGDEEEAGRAKSSKRSLV